MAHIFIEGDETEFLDYLQAQASRHSYQMASEEAERLTPIFEAASAICAAYACL